MRRTGRRPYYGRKNRAQMTYSQRKRAQLNYRAEYFRHNPGLFGCVWSCAYCHKPLLGMHNVVIDHIMPLNSPLGLNTRFNLVASCYKCNAEKSDNVDFRVIKGYRAKVFQSIVFTIQKVIILAFVGMWMVLSQIGNAIAGAFKRLPLFMKLILIVIILILLFGR